MRAPFGLACVLALFAVLPRAMAQSTDWPQFLGPDRNGIAQESELISQWPAGGPKVLWRVPGGVGMSGVAVSGKLAVTMWNSPEGQVLVALNTADGRRMWSSVVSKEYENAMGDGPRATPAIAGDRVYAYSGDGVLVCAQLATGRLLWKHDVVGTVGAKVAEYGMASSPVVVDGLVIVTAGGESTVAALDAEGGQRVWAAVDGPPGYSSPAVLNIAGEKQLVAFTAVGVSGIRIEDGHVLWHYPFKTPYDCNIATPIEVDGKVFISAGENHGCVMLDIQKEGDKFSVDQSWASVDVKSVMRNEWQTSVLIGGLLYGFDNVGSAGPVTHLACVDANTGETRWRENRFGKGNLVAADGKLWITNMAGEFIMAKPSASGYVELGRAELFGRTRQAASIAGGKAYVRDDAEVVCIQLTK